MLESRRESVAVISVSLEDQRRRFTMAGVWNLRYGLQTLHWMLGHGRVGRQRRRG
jgi:hypothetical protein